MTTKPQFIDDITKGGIYLWDNKSTINYHNLPKDYLEDWIIFFDICREASTLRTEILIQAIKDGLCPRQDIYRKWLTYKRYKITSLYLVELPFWYFDVGNKINAYSVIDFPIYQASEYYYEAVRDLVNTNRMTKKDLRRSFRHKYEVEEAKRRGKKVYAFSHIADAWRFIFDFMIDKDAFAYVGLR